MENNEAAISGGNEMKVWNEPKLVPLSIDTGTQNFTVGTMADANTLT
ncbi:MAG: hypothetical protein WCS99_16185 [Limisphaerales bacterium]